MEKNNFEELDKELFKNNQNLYTISKDDNYAKSLVLVGEIHTSFRNRSMGKLPSNQRSKNLILTDILEDNYTNYKTFLEKITSKNIQNFNSQNKELR